MDSEFVGIIQNRRYYLVISGKTNTSAVKLICLSRPDDNMLSIDQTITAIKHSRSAKVKVARPNTFGGKYQSKKEVLALLQSLKEVSI